MLVIDPHLREPRRLREPHRGGGNQPMFVSRMAAGMAAPGPLKTAVGVSGEIYIDPFDPAHLASTKAAVRNDGRAPGGASPGLPHPAGAGAYGASVSAASS